MEHPPAAKLASAKLVRIPYQTAGIYHHGHSKQSYYLKNNQRR